MSFEAVQTYIFVILMVLLPLIPSILLFRYLPSTGQLEGPFQGMKIKFGGAIAAYLVLVLIILLLKPADWHHFHKYTVSGMVSAQHTPQEPSPSLHEVLFRLIPPSFAVHNDGTFSVEVIVPDGDDGRPDYPSLQLDLPEYAGATISIDPGRSAYGSQQIPLKVDGAAIHLLAPAVLLSKHLQPNYKDQEAKPLQPGSAPTGQ